MAWFHFRTKKLGPRLKSWAKRRWYVLLGLFLLLIGYANCLPEPLFDSPVCTVLTDRDEQLLGARIATDGQWRFPPLADTVPRNFATSLIAFEDKRFYSHPGVDPLAIGRALVLNIRRGEVVSGGSTLSMQVIRMARGNRSRTIWEKMVEVVLSTRLEWSYSKEEILGMYASHAPFGGNVVGLDAAAWKYFGRNPFQLSWAESATLAVLPNAPALIHPGRNRSALLEKRNRLLATLLENGEIDSTTHTLACLEPLPERPLPLPAYAPHLLDRVQQLHLGGKEDASSRFVSTLNRELQQQANRVVRQHYLQLKENGIYNSGVLILEVESGEVMAYVGNTSGGGEDHGQAVDVIPALRSTGSIMKPFLYAAMLQEGELLPDQLVPDIPTYYSGYHPTNFDNTYQGAVPASKALSRSLNVPIVRMLQSHGITRFYSRLQRLGLSSLSRPSSDYGLSLILGGAEASLWELSGIYASMARSLKHFPQYDGQYASHEFRAPTYSLSQSQISRGQTPQLNASAPLEAGPIWHTFEAMARVSRPEIDKQWEQFASSHKIAWKTGTSYGYRDAWAIGVTPDYVVGVWVGNADGEGRQGLIGAKAAAPLMLQMFDLLPKSEKWFAMPYDDLQQTAVCKRSGHKASEICTEVDTVWIPRQGANTGLCPYHQWIQLDESGSFRLNSDCASPFDMTRKAFFVMPPTQEKYYRSKQAFYRPLPPFRGDCESGQRKQAMEIIYPRNKARIYVPVELDGTLSSTVFEAAHRNPDAIIYWHLDEQYLGKTSQFHQMSLQPTPGYHVITLTDEQGEILKKRFEVLAKN